MYSEKLTDKYETWMDNALNEKKGYILMKSTKNRMVLLVGKTVEPIVSLYVSLRMEDATEKKITYDIRKNETAQPIEEFEILLKDRERMILRHGEWGQGFGFTTDAYKRDPLMNHGEVTNVFVYCRTPGYHTFIFADRDMELMLWPAVKVIDEFAPIDNMERACPDSITMNMDRLWGIDLTETDKEEDAHV